MKLQFLSVLVLFSIVGCAISRNGSLMAAHEAWGDRDCGKVLEQVSLAEKTGTPSLNELAEVSFLRGLCAEHGGDMNDAIGAYEYVFSIAPNSEYGYRARAKLRRLNAPSTESSALVAPDRSTSRANQERESKAEAISRDHAITIARTLLVSRGQSLKNTSTDAVREDDRWHVFIQPNVLRLGGGTTVVVDAASGEVIETLANQ